MLLGLVAMATGVQEAIAGSAHPLAGHPRAAAVLAVGAALFLAGDAAIRRLLGTGSTALRLAGAAAALAGEGRAGAAEGEAGPDTVEA